jgi:segregation and condensation protein A
VADAVEELVDELPRVGRITFRRLTQDLIDRLQVIVRFLAVLELYKQGLVELEQLQTFGDLAIVWLGQQGALVALGTNAAVPGTLVDLYEG